jgi:thiol-disulfide isomerase/thioredoxin
MRLLRTAIAIAAVVTGVSTTASGAPPDSSTPDAAADPCRSATGDPATSDHPEATEPELPAWQSLEIVDIDGVSFTLGDCAGTPVLVELFATWCSNCRQQLPKTNEAAVTMGDQAEVIALSVETDLDPRAVAEYADSNEFPDIRFAVLTPELLAAFVEEFGNTAANPPSTPKIIIDATGMAGEMTTGQESVEELVAQLTAAAAPGDTATTTG